MSVFIVASVRLHREGLERFLGLEQSILVTGAVATCNEALDQISREPPDVVLLDLDLTEGTMAARRILRAAPGVKVVALWIAEVDADVIAWAEAGVSGYIGPDASLADLVVTIRSAPRGEIPCPPRVAAMLLRRVASFQPTSEVTSSISARLTFREKEIAGLIASGMSNKEISTALSIALPTVKNHVHNILEKTRVRRRGDVVVAGVFLVTLALVVAELST